MLCEICGKNEATIHIEEITDGKSKTLHLCGECMAKNPSLGGVDINAFNLGDIICNWAGGVNKKHSDNGDNNSESSDNKKTVICDVCGWTAEKLHKTGRLGCPECYRYFHDMLAPALNTMHRGITHTGKNPAGNALSPEREILIQISALKNEQKKCIAAEDYEQAAVLRDKISSLEEDLKRQNTGAENE